MSVVIPSLRGAIAVPGWAKNELWRKARAVPSLDLRFADSKSLVDATTGSSLVTFTRASSGTYTDSARVLQTAVTNLLLRSSDYSASWFQSAVTPTYNTTEVVDPAGGNAATKFVVGTNGAIGQGLSPQTAISHTASIYLRVDTGTTTTDLVFYRTSPFELVGSKTVTLTTDWQRFDVTGTFLDNTQHNFQINFGSNKTVYVWGAQVEAGAFPTSYIPTTSTINSAPRFDHNPTTGESLGLLVEEQRSNLCLQSEAISTPWSVVQLTVTANSIAAPNATTTADALFETASTSEHRIRQLFTGLTANTNYTVSVFAKDLGGRNLNIRVVDTDSPGNGYLGTFSPSTGTVVGAATLGSGVEVSASVVPYANGWYKFILTGNVGPTCTKYILDFFSTFGFITNFTGDVTKGLYLWGAQLEAGAFPTSYIPTTTAAVTRSADVASITGSAFSGWYRQDEGTVFGDYVGVNNVSGGTRRFVEIGIVGSVNDRMVLGYGNVVTSRFLVVEGGATQADIFPSAIQGARVKTAACFAVNDFQQGVNGTLGTADTSGSVPTVSAMALGGDFSGVGASWLNGHIRRLTFFPQRLANSTLQQITQ